MSPTSASHRPKQAQMAYEIPRYHCSEFQTHAFHVYSTLHGSHYLSCEFTGSAKLAPEKQTSLIKPGNHCKWKVYVCRH